MCIGTGWIAGQSAIEDLDRFGEGRLDRAEITAMYADQAGQRNPAATPQSDLILRELQEIMFAYEVSILKRADRLQAALDRLAALRVKAGAMRAPHTHELVRLKETEAMLLAAEMILGASLMRTESRVSHFREEHPERDDRDWLAWIDIVDAKGRPGLRKNAVGARRDVFAQAVAPQAAK
jgi:succinate dehydrogenase/fumarate reductase flavoprotein subunit